VLHSVGSLRNNYEIIAPIHDCLRNTRHQQIEPKLKNSEGADGITGV